MKYISNCEALQRKETELGLLSKAIQKHTKDYDVGQTELAKLCQKVKPLKDQSNKSLKEAEAKGGIYS